MAQKIKAVLQKIEKAIEAVMHFAANIEVGEGEVVQRREVRSGRRRPGEVEILEGLSEGDRVITEGTQLCYPDDAARFFHQSAVTEIALG